MNPRASAAKIITLVLQEGESLTSVLNQNLKASKDASLIQEICYGVLRWLPRLEKLAQQFLQKSLKAKDQDIYALLLIGFYQLLFMRVAEHAAVFETVEATKELKKIWAEKLINGILRNFLRQKENILKKLDTDPVSCYAHPLWLLNRFKRDWPDDWEIIANNNNQHPPMTLRVNKSKITPQSFYDLLQENAIVAKQGEIIDTAFILEQPMDVTKIPGFEQGLVSIQDEGAQIAAHLLELNSGQRVLDACAAPGGKSAHILELEPQIAELIAVEIDANRAQKITSNLERLQLSAKTIIAEAQNVRSWWDGKSFDRILLDAPCSATGVIRRHPDIKSLRRGTDINNLATRQSELLENLWITLKPKGILVYVTCSVLAEENEEIISAFLQKTQDAAEKTISINWGRARPVGRQILPGENNMDGFYYAVLEKIA